MAFYTVFAPAFALTVFRFLRAGKFREKALFFLFFLFLILSFAMHPWIESSSAALRLLQNLTLALLCSWLAVEPVLEWREKREVRKRAFALLRNGKGPLFEVVSACRLLSGARQGGLIALERNELLMHWVGSGVPVGAALRKETIFSLFTPPGALHDGGMIIREGRIAAAGVVFPLSRRLDLPTELGTRHRAGLGLSESTDAVVLIVSEETGKISIANRGVLLYDVKSDRLPELLEASLKNRSLRRSPKTQNSRSALSPEPALH